MTFEEFAERWFGPVKLQIQPKDGYFYPQRELTGRFINHVYANTGIVVRFTTEQEAQAFLSGKYGPVILQEGE